MHKAKDCSAVSYPVDCQKYAWWHHLMETFSALLALCAGNHRSPVNSPCKGQWRGALIFSLICAWINGWVNNREASIWDAIAPIMTSLYWTILTPSSQSPITTAIWRCRKNFSRFHLRSKHWVRYKMAAFSQTTYSHEFSWMEIYEFRLTFHWHLFLKVKSTMFEHWFG